MHASRDTPAPQANVSQAVTAAFYYSDSRRFPPECSRKLTAALSIPPQAFGYGKQGFQGDAVPLSIGSIN